MRSLAATFVALPLAAAAFLGWRWDALAPRSWPETTRTIRFTDDERFLVSLDAHGTLRLHELDNPIDRRWGGRPLQFEADQIVHAFSPWKILIARATSDEPSVVSWVSVAAREAEVVLESRADEASLVTDVLVGHSGTLVRAYRLSDPSTLLWSKNRDYELDMSHNNEGCGSPTARWFAEPSLSPDGASVAMPSSRSVTVHDARSGAVQRKIAIAAEPTWAALDDRGDLFVRSARGLECFSPDGTCLGEGFDVSLPICLAHDGSRVLVSGGNSALLVLEARSGSTVGRYSGELGALSRDGRRLVLVRADRPFEIVDVP